MNGLENFDVDLYLVFHWSWWALLYGCLFPLKNNGKTFMRINKSYVDLMRLKSLCKIFFKKRYQTEFNLKIDISSVFQ